MTLNTATTNSTTIGTGETQCRKSEVPAEELPKVPHPIVSDCGTSQYEDI